ncbi:hypothetical protein V8F44DRAFT_633058 [Aspergillus fumigatus]
MLWWLIGKGKWALMINKVPTFKEIIITTSVKYVNSKKIIEHTIIETNISNNDLNSTVETRYSRLSSVIIKDVNALEEPKLFTVYSLYINALTSKQILRLYYKLLVSLDDLEITGLESHILESDNDLIKACFYY